MCKKQKIPEVEDKSLNTKQEQQEEDKHLMVGEKGKRTDDESDDAHTESNGTDGEPARSNGIDDESEDDNPGESDDEPRSNGIDDESEDDNPPMPIVAVFMVDLVYFCTLIFLLNFLCLLSIK